MYIRDVGKSGASTKPAARRCIITSKHDSVANVGQDSAQFQFRNGLEVDGIYEGEDRVSGCLTRKCVGLPAVAFWMIDWATADESSSARATSANASTKAVAQNNFMSECLMFEAGDENGETEDGRGDWLGGPASYVPSPTFAAVDLADHLRENWLSEGPGMFNLKAAPRHMLR